MPQTTPPLQTVVLALLLVLLGLAGCGYYNPNLLPSEEQGPPINLYLPIWPNATNELGLESEVHNAISDWLLQSKRIRLVGSEQEAEFILNGRITSVSYPGLTYDATDTAKSLKAVLTVRYSITEKASGRILWQNNQLRLEETYNRGSSTAATDTNKRKVLSTLANDLGERIYIRAFRVLSKQKQR